MPGCSSEQQTHWAQTLDQGRAPRGLGAKSGLMSVLVNKIWSEPSHTHSCMHFLSLVAFV